MRKARTLSPIVILINLLKSLYHKFTNVSTCFCNVVNKVDLLDNFGK
nr:MAG TPA_asm: hypothetical protein [Caudoviricetes sp.]